MLRGLILALLVGAMVLLVAPFVVASRYVDQKGIPITGTVFSKRETIRVQYGVWKRTSEISVEYWAPGAFSVAFHDVPLEPNQYDEYHKGQRVNLRYLRPEDTPKLPMAHLLREIHALPTVRLANQQALSGVRLAFKGTGALLAVLCGMVGVLIFWRLSRLPKFAVAAVVTVMAGLTVLWVHDFPRPTQRPVADVRQTPGRVKSVELMDRLFRGSRSKGFETAQPIQIVGVEFVPAGKTDPVLAVDLIDAGSAGGLKENAEVPVAYESASPRTAYISGASRGFVSRNLTGIAVQIGLCGAVFAGFVLAAHYIGQAWSRLIARR